jgi:hypothetical protein
MAKNKHAEPSGGQEKAPSFRVEFPTIVRWASGYGWVEFGIDGQDRPFARASDEGGTVWESQGRYEKLEQALGDMEEGLARLMKKGGSIKKRSGKPRTRQRSDKEAQKSKGKSVKTPHRADVHPAAKKVKNLEEVAEALRRGVGFSVTRLTTIKRLCEDAEAAGAFALFLARKIQRRMREREAPRRYRQLVNRAVREMAPYLKDQSEESRERLWSLLQEIEGEQDEYENIPWGVVRNVKSFDLLVVEHALKAVLRPYEAPYWLYHAARDYTGKTDQLIPKTAPMVEEIAGFWRKHYGIKR